GRGAVVGGRSGRCARRSMRWWNGRWDRCVVARPPLRQRRVLLGPRRGGPRGGPARSLLADRGVRAERTGGGGALLVGRLSEGRGGARRHLVEDRAEDLRRVLLGRVVARLEARRGLLGGPAVAPGVARWRL